MKSFSLVILTSLLVSPVAFAQSVENQVKDALQTAETGLYDLIDKDMTTVNFTRGGSSLSEAEMRNIRAVYKSVLAVIVKRINQENATTGR
ncbi:MAG: hypothetical protein EOP04_12685 [Proteobacteria bacterium]|nr:MAG: hypothetical protein EOP04_12685 [Pseudomonadota bacterium]